MRLLAKGVYYNDLPLVALRDKKGTSLTPPFLSFINENFVSVLSFKFDENKRMYEIVVNDSTEVSVGDVVTLSDGVFTVDSFVAKVSIDKKIILLPQDKKLFNLEIENITDIKFNRKFIIDGLTEDGVYYTDNGELVFISNAFNFSNLLSLSDIRVVYPVLREGKATEDWELVRLKEVAYLKLLSRLSLYEKKLTESFYYLDTGLFRDMLLKQIAIIYQESLPANELVENKKLSKLENDLSQLFRSLIEVFSINSEGEINTESKDLTLLEF